MGDSDKVCRFNCILHVIGWKLYFIEVFLSIHKPLNMYEVGSRWADGYKVVLERPMTNTKLFYRNKEYILSNHGFMCISDAIFLYFNYIL